MKNMMLLVRNFKVFVLCSLLIVALSGCKDKNGVLNPYVTPGNVEDPGWVANSGNMTVSMTAVIKVSFAKTEGSLAAFMGGKCCGVGVYNNGLYWLYISPDTETDGDVQLRFYSPELKRIFVAEEAIPFHNDTQLGTVSNPFTPYWIVAQ